MRELYRSTNYGLVFRCIGDNLPEVYDYKTKKWVQDQAALDAFYEGDDTHISTKEEVERIIAETAKRIRT